MWSLIFILMIGVANGLKPRIIGGTTTTIGQYPYQVSIHLNGKLHCGGSIISKDWILTAAHCVFGENRNGFQIRVGSTYNTKEGTLIKNIAKIISHEYYDDFSYEYDVALIQLSSSIKLSKQVKPVTLAALGSSVNVKCNAVVTGWGKTSFGGVMSDKLRYLKVPVVEQKVCQKIYASHGIISQEMLCAGHLSGGKDTCQGDSGGPLVCNGVQIGIVSWGMECAKAGYPGVYTRISAIRSWITKWANV